MANLPFLALLEVFKALVDIDPGTPQRGHGGALIRWDSHEIVRPMALVSRSWEFAARQVLYGSVAVLGEEAASLFLRTVRAKPELGRTVRSLVIGVIEEDESLLLEIGQRQTSTLLLGVLNACPRVEQLQVRPLHESVRDALLAAISTKPLRTIVCAPRLPKFNAGWTRELFRAADLQTLFLPTLQKLELDIWATRPARFTRLFPSVPPLIVLRLFSAVPNDILFPLLTAIGKTLEILDVYQEDLLPPDDLWSSLLSSTPSLRSLKIISNPVLAELNSSTPLNYPAFDRLLPHFARLERLEVSATEISANAMRRLPRCLRHLAIQSYNPNALFVASELLDVLLDESIDITLESVTVRDVGDAWDEDELDELGEAFQARGIMFSFVPDVDPADVSL